MGVMRASLSTATVTIVSTVVAVTIITVTNHTVPSVLETIVTLVLGAGAGAVGGYGVGKSERLNGGGGQNG